MKYCFNYLGLGCKVKGEEWIKQQEEFSNFLAELSGTKEDILPVKQSLEEKSKQTKCRVQYVFLFYYLGSI